MLHIYLIACCIIVSTSHIAHPMDKDPSAQRPFFETQDKRKFSSKSSSKRKSSNEKSKLPKRSSDIPCRKTQNLLALYNISKSDPTLLHTSKRSSDDSETSPRAPSSHSLSPRSANKFLQRTTSAAKISRTSDVKKQTFTLIEVLKAKKPDHNLIQETLQLYKNDPDKNINEQDEYKNTPLLWAVINRNGLRAIMKSYEENIIDPLLTDPRLDTTIKNKEGYTAIKIITGADFEPDLRRRLFSRNTLDIEVHQEIFNMLMDLRISDKVIEDAVETIEKKIRELETKQGDTDLPAEASFPKYATKQFIMEMIKHRIKKEQASVKELRSELSFFNPNPVDDIYEATKNNDLPLVKKFLDDPQVNPNHQDAEGNTALHYATMYGYSTIVNALLRCTRVNSYLLNNKKESAYDLSKETSYTELSEILSLRLELDKKIRDKALILTLGHNDEVKENRIHKSAQDIYSRYISLPEYITEEFITKMLSSHVQQLQLSSTTPLYKPNTTFSQFNKTSIILLDESSKK